MEQIKKMLEERKKFLVRLRKEKEKSLSNAPEGHLRVCGRNGVPQYYLRREPKDFNGQYISMQNIQLAKELAQKDYDKKILEVTEKEINVIDKFLAGCPKMIAEEIYSHLHNARQKLVNPILETDEEYIKKCEEVQYEKKGFDSDMPEFYTAKGERVRSKSEVIIADLLNREGIPYRYECPIKLKGVGIIHPDFTILHVKTRREIFLEHLGMMDEPFYAENAIQRILGYEQNGIYPGDGLVLTYETKKNPLNQKQVMSKLLHYLH